MDDFLEACNHTELYQLARIAGLDVHPTNTKEELVVVLRRDKDPVGKQHQVDAWRDAIYEFVNEYWDRLQTQLTCPQKERSPRACYGCIDQQVMHCVVNKSEGEVERFVQLRRK